MAESNLPTTPVARVLFNDSTLEDLGIENGISDVSVTRSISGLARMQIIYQPSNPNMMDADIFNAGNIVKIYMGYPGSTEEQIDQGEFFIDSSSLDYSVGNLPKLTMTGYANAPGLIQGEKQRSFKQTADSEIAKIIAEEHSLKTEDEVAGTIEETPYAFEQVTQASETDIELLQRRAMIYGFAVYVDKQVLHFRRVFLGNIVDVFGVAYGKELKSIRGGVEATQVGRIFVSRDYDPVTGEIFQVSGSVDENEMTVAVRDGINKGAIRSTSDITGGEYYKFIMGAGHRPSAPDALLEASAATRADAFLSAVEAEVAFSPNISPMAPVHIMGFGRFEGVYVVSSVSHLVSGVRGQATSLQLSRSFEMKATAVDRLSDKSSSESGSAEYVEIDTDSILFQDQRDIQV